MFPDILRKKKPFVTATKKIMSPSNRYSLKPSFSTWRGVVERPLFGGCWFGGWRNTYPINIIYKWIHPNSTNPEEI